MFVEHKTVSVSLRAPRATVILAAHNAGRYVRAAIDSILAQTWTDFELILIDDGSTDDTLRIMRRVRDPRARLVARENRGIVSSGNEGLSVARGDIIFRMDADDIARPTRFAEQIAYLDAHPECVAVGSRILLIDPDGMPLIEMIDKYEHEDIDAANLLGGSAHICNPSVAMRKEAVIAVGGYRDDYNSAEDLDLFLRLAEVGRIANLPRVLLEYRQHLASVGYAKALQQRCTANRAVDAARTRRKLPPQTFPAADTQPRIRADEHRKWAWWGLQGGNIRTARKHALRALVLDPTSKANLRLIGCALRGR